MVRVNSFGRDETMAGLGRERGSEMEDLRNTRSLWARGGGGNPSAKSAWPASLP
jgi:hypothetical protein